MADIEQLEEEYGNLEQVFPRHLRPYLSPFEQLRKKELEELITVAMQGCTERQKMAIHLRYFQDMKYKEVAEAMSISMRTVSVYLSDAKKRIGARLRRLGFGPPPVFAASQLDGWLDRFMKAYEKEQSRSPDPFSMLEARHAYRAIKEKITGRGWG